MTKMDRFLLISVAAMVSVLLVVNLPPVYCQNVGASFTNVLNNTRTVADTFTFSNGGMINQERLWYNDRLVHVRVTNRWHEDAFAFYSREAEGNESNNATITLRPSDSAEFDIRPGDYLLISSKAQGYEVQLGSIQGKTVDWPVTSLEDDPLYRP